MATTNHELVGRALDLLREGLAPYVQREIRTRRNQLSMDRITRYTDDPKLSGKGIDQWDVSALLSLMGDTWRDVFQDTLGYIGRSLVSELRQWRNNWAHQERFSSDDADRALDSAGRMLELVSAPQAAEILRMKMQLRRRVLDEQVRGQKRRTLSLTREEDSTTGIKAWRDVVEPHDDVASGRYQQAEFAADLGQVHRGEGTDEYRDPIEFFRRTYLTESLKTLLVDAIRRVTGNGGDPVIQLQTNFGGGKTHSMLALYHLLSGMDTRRVPGLAEGVLAEAGVNKVDRVRRVVLVGTQIAPGSPTMHEDISVNTLWGELAYQLGGREAYERVRTDDEHATNPGDKLRQLLVEYGPCAILIDEWVAYARQLHKDPDLPAGTFETQFTFAQTLSESVKLTENCLLLVSLPASDFDASLRASMRDDSEIGGARGYEALERLRNVIARVETPWRPATAEEGFEIVRRRLFKDLRDDQAFKDRDIAAKAYADLYRNRRAEFPADCDTLDYENRIRAAYPIHPEVFDRLYTDWSSLAKFQRTRGVLRLMATVIHSLWEAADRSPLIQPWNFHLDDERVLSELTRYLPDYWMPVIEKDIDGPKALPITIDRETPSLGQLAATRRVARSIYLGSAPITEAARRGIDDKRITLGCVVPGEAPAKFGDALRRLAAQATYLYQDGNRYWYSTQPTVAKLAADRAEELRSNVDAVTSELDQRLRKDLRDRGEFSRIHNFAKSPSDVPDENEARLVVLSFESPYSREENKSLDKAKELLQSRGNTPRLYQNTLVFLAADSARLQDLVEALRRFLAWRSIIEDFEKLNLDPHQKKQAESQCEEASSVVTARIPETYQWLLVPHQETTTSEVTWKSLRLSSSGSLAERASRRLLNEEYLIGDLGPTILRHHLDSVPLWNGTHVGVRELVNYFGQYLYLPRLTSPEVLMRAIESGIGLLTWQTDAFAYADDFDGDANRFRGLRHGAVSITRDNRGLLVEPDAASAQLDRDQETPQPADPVPSVDPQPMSDAPHEIERPQPIRRRFHATAALDQNRMGTEAGQIAAEVVSHLSGLVGSKLQITLEIEATVPGGIPDDVARVVTENCSSLRFGGHAFEES